MRLPHFIAIPVALLAFPALALAQGALLKLPNFTHLQKQAVETVDVTIDSWPLSIISHLMNAEDQESTEMKATLAGLKKVIVRSYQFDDDFVYSKTDIDAVRSQLNGPGWSQLAKVRNRREQEDVDVYIAFDHDKVCGFAVIATEPRQFTILNIVGSIKPGQLAKLQKQLALPDAGLDKTSVAAP